MQIVGILILFFMAGATAGQASRLESDKLTELWMNYLLGLFAIGFGLSFSMMVTRILTGEVTNMHLLILLAVIPGFLGVVLNDWVVEQIESLRGRTLFRRLLSTR